MSDLLGAAKAHFSALVDGELESLEVKEWPINGEPAKIFFRRYLTVEQKGELVALYNENKPYEMMVMAIIYASRKENGDLWFNKMDKFQLMRQVDPTVIEDIFGRMELFSVDEEEISKK